MGCEWSFQRDALCIGLCCVSWIELRHGVCCIAEPFADGNLLVNRLPVSFLLYEAFVGEHIAQQPRAKRSILTRRFVGLAPCQNPHVFVICELAKAAAAHGAGLEVV